MTAQEAAPLLGRGSQTITNWVRDGRIDGQDLGEDQRPRWLVLRAAVEARRRGYTPDDDELRRRVTELEEENSELRAEVQHLNTVARNLRVALQVVTATVEEYQAPRFPPTGRT